MTHASTQEVKPGRHAWWQEVGDFWHQPASTTGKNHRPGQTQGDHAYGVFRLAVLHWRRCPWKAVRKNWKIKRSFLRAALFHDVGKKDDRYNHDVASYVWLMHHGDPLAGYFALCHMGRWGSVEVKDILNMPIICDLHAQAPFRWLAGALQVCDYTDAICFDI